MTPKIGNEGGRSEERVALWGQSFVNFGATK
eukprot:CAMPEP_0183310754 /NCGR_PEP_ID=MMETSP0160_2-20130417/33051_1 /TAXON_ID=2839 ORGANISM="Odontella Sinensis, Strain Grunow 1884" /NCGR_SAMPLE_ID=MMETSP0160_2 /ASSEMBLY_ACC=CAM_ASM_000250 /LENGTH=30 /DNA_ID= /DNA_START= /DNA_END= /DNA_ORIENTATION=